MRRKHGWSRDEQTILLAVSVANFAMGFMAAAFFGYGPAHLHKFSNGSTTHR
jgi:hypothetical protein